MTIGEHNERDEQKALVPSSKRRSRRKRRPPKSDTEATRAQSTPTAENLEALEHKSTNSLVHKEKLTSRQRSKQRGHRVRQKPNDPLREAVQLIDKAVREEARRLGVLRLSPIHLDFMIGDGEALNLEPSPQNIDQQVKKLNARIADQLHSQMPSQWRRGTIYCFNSDQAIEPPSYDSIFTGYDSLGRPQWTHLLPLCLSLQVPHLDRLYSQPPRVISLAMSSPIGIKPIPEVTNGRVYEPLAQVILGPLSSSFRPLREAETRFTLTAQVLLTQPPERGLSVHLNVLGLDPDILFEEAAKGAPRGPLARARNSLQNAQRAVRRLQEQLRLRRISPEKLPAEAEGILSELSDQLIRVVQGDLGRTQHGKARHHSMERPTSEAWRDANRVGVERLFWDGHQETIVVIGPKSRAHIFSEDGRHVTSMRLGPGELEKKTSHGRWLPLDQERIRLFRSAVKQRVEL